MTSHTGKAGCVGGFTLLELLVVLVIASLLVALVPPLFSAAVPGARLKGAARDLATVLRETRSQAITRNREIVVRLNTESPGYSIDGANPRALPDRVKMSVLPAGQENALQATDHAVHFYPDGSTSGTRIDLSMDGRGYRLQVGWLLGSIEITEAGDAYR